MGIAGPLAAYYTYKLLKQAGASQAICVFTAAALADLFTYVVTSLQLGLAFPAEVGGIAASIASLWGCLP
jgi:cobalt/nickel transport system permease protein